MANTTTIHSAATANGYTLHLELTETGVSAAANASAVTWRLYLTGGSWSFSQYRVGWSVSLNGAAVSSKSKADAPQLSIARHGEVTVKSGSATVPHGADGTLTMTAAASIDMDAVSYTPGPMSLAGSLALTAIPRSSTLTVSDGTLGTAQTLTVKRRSAAFTHTLSYVCGSYSSSIGMGDFTGTGDTLERQWTPLLSLAAQNTAGQTVSVTLTLTTKNGGATVGTDVKTVTMTIPASVKPSCTASVETVNDNAAVSGWGVAVKGFSRYAVTAAFTGAQGSTLSALSVRVAATGQTLTASPAQSDVLTSTSRTVKVRVKDSRGRWSDAVTVTGPKIYDYVTPAVSAAAAFRCDSAGTADDSGAYLSVRCAGSVSSCGGHNVRTVQFRRKVSGGSWTGWTSLTNDTATVVNANLPVTASCRVQFRVSDSLGGSRTVTVTVPTAAVTFHLRPGGGGAAFGKYAEADGQLQSAWALKLDTPLEVASGGTGQSARYAAVTVTPDTSVATGHAVTVRHYPYPGLCFVRGMVKVENTAVAADTWITAVTVPEDYRPAYTTALSAAKGSGGGAFAQIRSSDGAIRVSSPAALASSGEYYIYFSGWWLCA